MQTRKRRGLADTVGFAHLERQIEEVMRRIAAQDGAKLERILEGHNVATGERWRLAIAPHDDYAYAGFMYPLVLRNVAAPVVIIFGVAHRARELGLEDRLVFDSYSHWQGPYGDIAVSPLRESRSSIGRLGPAPAPAPCTPRIRRSERRSAISLAAAGIAESYKPSVRRNGSRSGP